MTITRVQGPARGTNTGTSVTVTMGATPQSGNVLVATVGIDCDNSVYPTTVVSITQTGVTWGSTPQNAKSNNNGAAYGRAEIWYGVVGAGASKTITVVLDQSSCSGVVDVCEYSGMATSNFLDQIATNAVGSGDIYNAVTGTTPTTTQANELWIGVIGGDASSTPSDMTTPTNGFTLVDGVHLGSYCDYASLEKIVSATGTAGSGASVVNAMDGYAACIATFFAAAGATNVNVTDSLGLSDSVLCNKTLAVADSLGAIDAFGLCNKTLAVTDSVGVVDAYGLFDPAIFDPVIFDTTAAVTLYVNKTLKVADSSILSDLILRNKTLIVSDVVSLSELINVITGAIIKTVTDAIGISDVALINKTAVIADAVSVLDQVFRHKPSVSVADVVAAAEAVLVSKLLLAADGLGLADQALVNKPVAIADAVGIVDAVFRHKPSVSVADSVSLADVFKVLKTLNVSDVLGLVDAASTPSRVLHALDAVGLADNAFVNKALLITDSVSLVEVVWAGKRRETALYLVVGNLVVNLKTGKVDFAL